MAWYKKNLLNPFARAMENVSRDRNSLGRDFKALKKTLKTLPKSLSKLTGIGGFTFSNAVRVAAWTRQGMEVPGLSKRDVKELNDFVSKNAELNTFVDELIKIQKGKPYPKPKEKYIPNAKKMVEDKVSKILKEKDLSYYIFRKKDAWDKEESLAITYLK